jgi:MFS family permease
MPTFWSFVLLLAISRPMLTTTNAVVPVVASEEAATVDRTAALAFMSAAYAIGAGLVSVLRSLGDGFGYRAVLLGAAATALTLPFVGRLVRDSPTAVRHAHTERPRFGLVERHYARPLILISLLAVLTNLVTGPALTWLFVFGEQVLGESPGEMATLVLLAGPVGLAGLLTGRWAGDRIGRRTTSALGTAVAPIAAVYAYSGDDAALRIGYLVLVFALAFLGPPVAALLNEVMPTETRATANGWVGAAAVVGGVTGLATFGFLIDAMPTYRAAAATLFLPTVPLALGYLLVRDERAPDIAEIDATIQAEHGIVPPPGGASDVEVPTDE